MTSGAPRLHRRAWISIAAGGLVAVLALVVAVALTRSPGPRASAPPVTTGPKTSASPPPATSSNTPPPFQAPFVGTLRTHPDTAGQESAAGIKVAMLEVDWADWEPEPGQFNAAYESQVKSQLNTLEAAGMRVTLGLGLHFTPDWVDALPNSHLVDEAGHVSAEADFTFNSAIRDQAESYLQRIDTILGFENFWAVRITSGGRSELLYPSGGGYWAFGRNPQNGPQYPASLPKNPFPGWRPGDGGLSPTQLRSWYDWYVGALADTADWQMSALKSLGYTGYFQILTPGVGVLPASLERAIAQGLPDGLLGQGAAWQEVYRLLPHKQGVMVYVTSMGDGSGGNLGCGPFDATVPLQDPAINGWSATRWLTRIATQYGLPIAGENPGYRASPEYQEQYLNPGPDGLMSVVFAQARSCHLQGVYWAHDDELWNDTIPATRLFAQTTAGAVEPPPNSN
jgi:hypothetical protein